MWVSVCVVWVRVVGDAGEWWCVFFPSGTECERISSPRKPLSIITHVFLGAKLALDCALPHSLPRTHHLGVLSWWETTRANRRKAQRRRCVRGFECMKAQSIASIVARRAWVVAERGLRGDEMR